MLNRNRLHGLLLALVAGSYGLLGYLYLRGNGGISAELCPINRITGIPCPSCGTARSVLLMLEGNLPASFMTNPLGYLAMFLLISIPVWVALDVLMKKNSLYRFFRKAEAFLKQNVWLAALLILLIIANWIWNITKGY